MRQRWPIRWVRSGGAPARRGYVDFNLTYGWRGLAVTCGLVKETAGGWRGGWHPYLGGGFGTAGPSGALTVSPSNASTGWTAGVTSCNGTVATQVGVGGSPFFELGVGRPRGTSLTAYHVW